MPIFEYVCAECGKPFEQLVLNTSKVGEVTCPACHSQNITRKISTFASRFSGGSSSSFGNTFSSASCSTGSV
jgi:putative FmdB family regulatory protein